MNKPKIKIPVLLFAALSMGVFLVLSFYGLVARKQAQAATTSTINFQARLMTAAGAIVPDGNYNVEFKIYNTSSSSGSSQGSCTGDSACLWAETRTSANVVRVANGYLTVDLGSVTSFPTTINWDQSLWITMNIGGKNVSPSWDGEMSPRLKLTGVPYAFRAGQLAANNGSFTSTLGFVQPTASNSILLPDASGTVCLQNSSACGFALSSGSGNYIQNGTSLQSGANFNISGTGTAATSLQAPLLDTATAVALNIGTTNATGINLNKSTVITGGISQSGGTISLVGNAASSITTSTGALTLTAAGSSNWTVGGTNQSLTITTSGTGTLTMGTTGAGTVTIGSSTQTINIGATNNTRAVHIADGGTSTNQVVTMGSTNSGSTTTIQGGTSSTALNLTTGTNGSINLTTTGTGTNLIRSAVSTIVRDTSAGVIGAFQIQNASSTALLNVDTTSNGLITMSTGLRLSVNATTADTFTTPLGTSVKSAINIPIYDPGAAGQLLAFGLGSTANATARGISVFDARSAGVIQPAIALFSPNENDVFGLSWNGLNTVASLETSSAAIALRPGGTNVKLWAGSTGVAVGSNVSSASYPLDVTGDVNTSTQYRIAGTVICTSSGCTPAAGSGNYIQNSATVQSANMYVQAASSGSVAGVLRANAAGSGDILDLKNGAGTNVATFGSTGAVALQNSTNSTAAFQVTALNTNAVLRVDTTNERVAIGVISDPIGAKLSVATSSAVTLRGYQGSTFDAFQLGNATADFLTVSSAGNLLLRPTTNSTAAFQIQNAAGTSNLLFADTTNTRIAIAQATAAYTLDVAGDINTTTQLRIAGTSMCDSTGCTAKSGSGFYIRNQTTAQSSNMYVQAASSGSVAGVFQANASGSGDILDLKDGSGNNVATFGSTGATTLKNSTNSGTAFQVQNASGGQLLNINSSNSVITLNGGAGGGLTAWSSTSSMTTGGSFGGSVVMNGYVYNIGGYAGAYSGAVRYAPIKANGTLGTWSTTTALGGARGYVAAASSSGYLYVMGGTDGSSNQNTIYIAKQNSDGTLVNWQTSPVTLPSAMNATAAYVVNGYLYVLGGNVSGSSTTATYYTHINGDGSINSFDTATVLPVALANGTTFAANGYLYYMGGINGSGTTVGATYYTPLNSDGSIGSWTSTTSLPTASANFASVVLNGNVYVIKNSTTVSYAPLNSNGTIGTWVSDSNALPVSYTGMGAVTYNGYIYVMGGYNGSAGTTGVYYTSGARTMVGGSLDLVGLTASGALTGDGTQESGSVGGTLTAGNTTVVGTLQVQGQSNFNQNVAINGNSLTVGNNLDSTSTGNTLITVQSRGFAGLELYGDSTNDNTAEGGGAYVLYSTDGILGTEAVTGLVQQADIDPSGTAYTGAVANNLLLGTRSNFGVQFGTNSTVRMVLTNGGNLCIGITSCTHKLAVNGQIYSTSSTITTGTPDLSETISAADNVEAMDVVVADPNNTERVIKSSKAYDSSVMGVVSDGTSGFLIDHLHYGQDNDPNDTTHRVPLTLAGRVYVKVTDESGSIKPGDYLTSSSEPGYAMKATKAGSTIGKALGYFDDTTGKVLVLVDPGYHDPSGGLQGTSNNFASLNVSGDATIHKLTVGSVDVSGDVAIAGKLTVVGQANVGDIVIAGHIITKGSLPTIEIQSAAGQNAQVAISGNDSVGIITITAGSGSVADILARVAFAKQYEVTPSVVISPVGKASAQLQPYVDQVSTGGFSIGTLLPVQNGTTYMFSYQTVQ